MHSAENAKAVAAKAKEQYRQGNWNLCHTCIIVLSVFVIFTAMIVAIRVRGHTGNLLLGATSMAACICQCAHSRFCLCFAELCLQWCFPGHNYVV